MAKQKYIERPPRIQPEMPIGEHALPEPPSQKRDLGQSLIQVGLPLLTIVGYVLISAFGSGRSILFILPMGLSVVASVALSIYSRRQEDKERERQRDAYDARLLEMRNDLVMYHDMQRRFYRHNAPDLRTCLTIANAANAHMKGLQADLALAARLWERRPSDGDFGALRVGIGTRPSSVVYALDAAAAEDGPLLRDAQRLTEDSRFVDDVPLAIQLRRPPGRKQNEEDEEQGPDPIAHAIGITGNHLQALYGTANALLVQLLTLHAPTDTSLLVLGRTEGEAQWEWIKPLPHCEGGLNAAWCFEGSGTPGDPKAADVSQFLKSLRKTLDQREARLRDPESKVDVTLPFLLVVVDLLQPLPDDSTLRDCEMDPAIALLMSHGRALGGSVLFLVPSTLAVPSGCQAVLDISLQQSSGQAAEISFRYAETGVNSPRFAGTADAIASDRHLREFAELLQPLAVRRTYGSELPPSVLMLEDVMGHRTAHELRAQMVQNWERSRQAKTADWLTCALGMMGGGDTRVLRFSADADGVHGMIAGSTGSGKSELLMSMILNMAYLYDPSIVNFVLVDFKGGGAFKPLEGLPHVVQVVTNLSEAAVERMFAAITAELNRRQAINTSTDSKDIVAYRKRGLHMPEGPYKAGRYTRIIEVKGRTHQTKPYPHLFVFIDEFAEMIANNPEYKEQLNSITRLGRALGVTLILAAQRPTGVTDQMRANIKFRIALRVETREESSEILRRPDAAYLPTGIPGRGYLQIGNENVELIQAAWTGNDYKGERTTQSRKVIWPDRPKRQDDQDEQKVFDMMVQEMQGLAREMTPPQRPPWPDFLPRSMTLQHEIEIVYLPPESYRWLAVDSKTAGQNGTAQAKTMPLNPIANRWLRGGEGWPPVDWEQDAMRSVVGILDNPYQAEQRPLLADLRRGHLAVFGASGWGKSTLLQTLMVTLAMQHSPDDLHIYVLDFGGRQLSPFEALPHVGAVITSDEEERVFRVIRMMDKLLDERKQLVTARGYADIYAYNAMNPDDRIPSVLVVIDNFAEFRETFEGLMPILGSVARDSRSVGIHFVITAELPNVLGGKLFSFFTERLAFRLSDPTEYATIVGRGARVLDEVPGRGYVQLGRRAVEFQVALPAGEDQDGKKYDLAALLTLIEQTGQRIRRRRPAPPIETLTTAIGLEKLLDKVPIDTQKLAQPIIGIEDIDLKPWPVDFMQMGPHLQLLGPPSGGVTTALRTLILSLASSYTPDRVMIVLVDLQKRLMRYGGQRTLGDLPHVVDVISSDVQIEEFVTNLEFEARAIAELPAGQIRQLFVIVDNYDSLADEFEANRNLNSAFNRLSRTAREYGTFGVHFVVGASLNMRRDTLIKQVQSSSFGLALRSPDGAQMLNGRVPRSLAQGDLPLGRAFCVKSGQTFLVQIASPFTRDEDMQEDLDRWVLRTRNRYAGHFAKWSRPAESTLPTATAPVSTKQEDDSSRRLEEIRKRRGESLVTVLEKDDHVDVAALRAALEAHSVVTAMTVKYMTEDADVIQLAIDRGLFQPEAA